jgi:hypothetical protein
MIVASCGNVYFVHFALNLGFRSKWCCIRKSNERRGWLYLRAEVMIVGRIGRIKTSLHLTR